MRARIPPSNKQMKVLEDFAKKKIKKQRLVMCRKIFKVIIYVLNVDYGFGKGRIDTIIEKALKILEEYETNELFYEDLDRHVIDRVGIDFERDYSDL